MKQILEKYLAITLVLVLMTGCGSAADKEIMTAKEFQKKMEGMGLTVEDQTSSATDSTYHDYELEAKKIIDELGY